jgi:hypothetical protein
LRVFGAHEGFRGLDDVFKFLDLPGEIRNSIYDYCEPTAPQKSVHGHDPGQQTISHTAFNLAQVNKQISSELLPLCVNEFTHRVQFADLPSYVQTSVAPHDAVSGTIDIGVEQDLSASVNVVSLMHLLRKHINLRVAVKSTVPSHLSVVSAAQEAE